MGKVHRIKQHFWRLVSQEPPPTGYFRLAHTHAEIHICKRPSGYYDVTRYSGDRAYKGVIEDLIKAHREQQRRG